MFVTCTRRGTTFCTLMLWLVLEKIKDALMALANRRAWIRQHGPFCHAATGPYLIGNLLLVLNGKVDKMVVLCADEDGNGRLVEASALAVPLLDAVEGALSRQVKHEEDGDGVVANEGQHVDKLALAAQVPDGKGDFRVANGYRLFHEIDAQRLDIVFVPAALDVLDHERRLADLGIAHHADLYDDVVAAVGGFARCLAAVLAAVGLVEGV